MSVKVKKCNIADLIDNISIECARRNAGEEL